jgi:hypothetical protein
LLHIGRKGAILNGEIARIGRAARDAPPPEDGLCRD